MKFMLMMHMPAVAPPGSGLQSWKAEEIQAHIGHMQQLNKELRANGELVAAEGLEFPPRPRSVRANGDGPPLVTDGPFVETKEFLTGFWIVECASEQRAFAIAARVSSAPGPGGKPLNMAIEVRQVMQAPPA